MVAVIAVILGALAALLHVYIFWMESFAWRRPAVWRRFGVASQEAADTVKPMAYNQGFYNLFLAAGTAIGLVLFEVGASGSPLRAAGFALALFALLSMVCAALVLVTSGRRYIGAAMVQGMAPLLASGLLIIAFVTS